MISTIEKVTGKSAKIDKFPMQPGDVNCTYADITKAKKLIDYLPSTKFETGVIKFYEWLKKNKE